MFLTFEGVDYSGKSTQARLLVERLTSDGHTVRFLREPGGTGISERIRDILLDRSNLALTDVAELLLFSASRAELVTHVIRPALARGETVVCDRYYDSTTVYQGYGRGLDLETIHRINRFATGGLQPDLTIVVDIPVDEIERRKHAAGKGFDRMESAGREFFERVRAGYAALAAAEPTRVVLVDGLRPVEDVRTDIWEQVQYRKSTHHQSV